MFWWTDDKLTRGARPGLVFLVHRTFEGRGGKGGISIVVGDTACVWEDGGTRFDSRLARIVVLL